jgi:hypothetical protein
MLLVSLGRFGLDQEGEMGQRQGVIIVFDTY